MIRPLNLRASLRPRAGLAFDNYMADFLSRRKDKKKKKKKKKKKGKEGAKPTAPLVKEKSELTHLD